MKSLQNLVSKIEDNKGKDFIDDLQQTNQTLLSEEHNHQQYSKKLMRAFLKLITMLEQCCRGIEDYKFV